jgi:hypothetical protein
MGSLEPLGLFCFVLFSFPLFCVLFLSFPFRFLFHFIFLAFFFLVSRPFC